MQRICMLLLMVCTGCIKMNDLKKNPNKATIAPPAVVLSGIEQSMFEKPWGDAQRHAQYYCITYSYYGNQSYDFGAASFYYSALRNIAQLEKEAGRIGGDQMRPYYALANFLQAWFYIKMTAQVGDIPMSEAMKAEQGIDRPAYDTQRDIYLQCLQLLQRAHDTIAILNATRHYTVDGDIFFNGNLKQWQKLINAFRLRVLISLSNKAGDPQLALKETFASILKLPLPESNQDNLQITYGTSDVSNYYPAYTLTPEADAKRSPLGATYINLLKALRDPRLFIVALPAAIDNADSLHNNDFSSYRGAATGTLQGALNDSASKGFFSLPDYHYWFSSPAGHPTILLGYAEVNFSIAEGIQRGWIHDVPASNYYEEGIRAAMKEYDLPSDTIRKYLAQPVVQYQAATGLQQILQQKYLAFFQHAGWEAFYNQRRTGIPAFITGPSNQNHGLIPRRWTYPASESIDNLPHLTAALKRQYNGADNINGVMWLLQ
ncbi:SusD/RagB family nutrient-binding outer membrane lipoprotein [Chitinophaga arvensicola]|uniref:Starch-binding associating with outer membrane n=1 Tax=Chitinophaga arvensicola TaxID=29529 RepID=A0A1I0R7Q3_9BACT|nr:SusD/RagB family nutrient-binding outer membrane lipoprotein [Chitinophaga arvensicola]SEW36619.1 Starch-binding associating with outer membrane [Chitinophaga arvensicola]